MNRKTQTLTVASKNPNVSLSGEELEEIDYVNVAVCTVNKMSANSDKKSPSFTQSFLPIAVSWVILLVIMALRIYFTSVISENNAKLTVQIDNLKQASTVRESKNKNLTAENQELETRNQELETERNNLTEQIQNMETTWNEQNVTRAQWSIDAYCPKKNGKRECKDCQHGMLPHQTSCYVIYDPLPAGQITWEEAHNDCKGKSSDLAVVVNEEEKEFLRENSWESYKVKGYWIGLRAEDGRWKWIDGSNLTESSWLQQPPTNGSCAISVKKTGWQSVNCGERHRWICKRKALSV